MGRDAVAEYLRTLADSLEADSGVTLRAGEQSVTLTPPVRSSLRSRPTRRVD
ncbi:amphi-Trp domain-containing protein [Haloarcula sp. S1CR25-12]|uniref:Amphi-Trp domain-containing protein n=1 Tax=Haloarcula saliterrae TaxID=2950534 RepID=A0ABU2FAZ7_9EURY|nr:amphi-Trp domain-containing protein [Haloarcula sp. S1CR25-12]MDS0258991.1 amphi-Trp domain-containing protein [Haloarcula sp. S1CR25-12]